MAAGRNDPLAHIAARPAIVAAEAVAAGAAQLLVLPLFMASGGHLRHDVPLLLNQIRHSHPHILVHMLPPIGEHPQVQAAIEVHAFNATVVNAGPFGK